MMLDLGRAHLAWLATLARRQALVALGLLCAAGLTEGTGLLLLLPLLQLVGIDVGQGAPARLARVVAAGFARVGARPTLELVLPLYVAIVGVQALLVRRQAGAQIALQYALVDRLRGRLYRAIAGANWPFLSRQRIAELTHALTSESDRIGAATQYLGQLCAAGLVAAVYLLLAVQISAALTGLIGLCGLALLFAQRQQRRRVGEAGEALTQSLRRWHSAASELLGGLKLIKSTGSEARSIAHADERIRAVSAAHGAVVRGQAAAKSWLDIGAVALLSGIVYVAVRGLHLSAAGLLLLIFLFARVLPRLTGAIQSYHNYIALLPAVGAVREQLARCEAEAEAPKDATATFALRSAVAFEGVEFGYAPGQTVVGPLDLVIPAGRTTAIVGPSGAGKSTLADLLLGLLEPTAGAIRVDGQPLLSQQRGAWQRQIGYVPQEALLFHDSLRANVCWDRPEASEGEIAAALGQAAAEFAWLLPEGLDTVVGERGTRLSGGERQRVALARALLRNPALLILDEATSNLDVESEGRILATLEALHQRVTILLITHRLATARLADTIHVLQAGRIVQSGDWEALITDRTGQFHALWQTASVEQVPPRVG
ncbi:MAG: ABC transporter ATP-binding protein [Chloroflexia bacterium]